MEKLFVSKNSFMLNGQFKLVGVETRTIEGKSYNTASLRAPDLSLHKVDSSVTDLKNYVDQDLNCVFKFKWGKYSAGIELAAVKPIK